MQSNAAVDRLSYRSWQAVQQVVESPLDRTPDFWKYVIASYPYIRSRLLVPGRAYDSEEHGMLAIGGGAHCDAMSLDVYLSQQPQAARDAAVEFMADSSPDRVAEYRRLGRGMPRNERVDRIAADAATTLDEKLDA